jgi:hypothetical protein
VRAGSLNVIHLALVLTGSSNARINKQALQLVFILKLLFPEAEARDKWEPSEKLVPLSDIGQHWTEKYFHQTQNLSKNLEAISEFQAPEG